MTSSPEAGKPYREGVGAVLFDRRGMVFVARRTDMGDDAWQMPQGGIDAGETPRQAVLRELAEEIGTDKATIIAEGRRWLRYDLPEAVAARAWGGRYRGQKLKWFALRFTGADSDIDLAAAETPEFTAWKWIPFLDLPAVIVSFKRRLYEEIVAEFSDLATAEP